MARDATPPSRTRTSTDTELVEAALAQFALTGVRRTSGDDIARRAGVNRATLYRRLGTKEQITEAAMLHEAGRVLTTIEADIGDVPDPGVQAPDFDPVEYVVRFFTVTLTTLRENRLLRQLLEIDPDEALVGLTLRAGGVLALSSRLVADRIRALRVRTRGAPDPDVPDDVDALAVTLARLTQSLLLTPDGPPLLDTPRRMRAYAEAVVVPMVLGDVPRSSP